MNRRYNTEIINPSAYKTIIALSMIYVSIMIANAVLTNRYIGTDAIFILGGTLTSPLIFILDDIIAEIYGYKIACYVILIGFLSQTLFALICGIVVVAPAPDFFKEKATYQYVLGSSLMQINFSGWLAYIFANLANTYILTRWKVLLKGRKFWLRSIGSSMFSEGLYSFLAILMMEFNHIKLDKILQLALVSYSIKACYSLFFSFPANALVNFLKKLTNTDIYDIPKRFTPFHYFKEETNHD